MKLASLDLNLLLVFRALMQSGSVTRAGEDIGLSQPAVSNALTRLRHHYRDPLFVRARDGMEPTARARELASPIAEALSAIEMTLPSGDRGATAKFDPSNIHRRFNIALVDFGGLHLVSRLIEVLVQKAPGMEIATHAVDAEEATQKLRRNEIDFAVGVFSTLPTGWTRRMLFKERLVVTVSRNHPRIEKSLSRSFYTTERHVGITPFGVADQMILDRGLKRRFAVSAGMLSVPFIVQRSDLVATLPSGVAKTFGNICGLKRFELPVPIDGYQIEAVTHPRSSGDVALGWLLGRIESVAGALKRELSLES